MREKIIYLLFLNHGYLHWERGSDIFLGAFFDGEVARTDFVDWELVERQLHGMEKDGLIKLDKISGADWIVKPKDQFKCLWYMVRDKAMFGETEC